MDRISKLLRKLDRATRLKLETLLVRIAERNFTGLDVKKFKGADHLFRVRVGSMRVIYLDDGSNVTVLVVERRNEKTYDL